MELRLLDFRIHEKEVIDLKFSPGGDVIASLDLSGNMLVWETATGTVFLSLVIRPSSALSFDGFLITRNGLWDYSTTNLIAFISNDETVSLWQVEEKRSLGSLHMGNEGVKKVLFSPNGAVLAVAERSGNISLWNAHQRLPLLVLEGHGPVQAMVFSSDSNGIAVDYQSEGIAVWHSQNGNTAEWHIRFRLSTPSDWTTIQMTLVGEVLIFSAALRQENFMKDEFKLWTARSTSETNNPTLSWIPIARARFCYIPCLGCVAAMVRTVRWVELQLFSIENGIKPPFPRFELPREHSSYVHYFSLSPDGSCLIGAASYEMMIWNTADGSLSNKGEISGLFCQGTGFSPDGTVIAIYGTTRVDLYDIRTFISSKERQKIIAVTVSPEEKLVAYAKTRSHAIVIYNIESSKTRRTLKGFRANDSDDIVLMFSRDCRYLAAWTIYEVHFWDLQTEEHTKIYHYGLTIPKQLAFSGDGGLVAFIEDYKGTVTVLETGSWRKTCHHELLRPSEGRSSDVFKYLNIVPCAERSFIIMLFFRLKESLLIRKGLLQNGKLLWYPINLPNLSGFCNLEEDLAYSPTTNLVAAIGCSKTQIWSAMNSNHQRSLSLSGPLFEMHANFCSRGQCLLFKHGVLRLPYTFLPDPSNACNCGHMPVMLKHNWLFWRGKALLYVPPGSTHEVPNAHCIVQSWVILSPTCIIRLGWNIEDLVRDQPLDEEYRDWYEESVSSEMPDSGSFSTFTDDGNEMRNGHDHEWEDLSSTGDGDKTEDGYDRPSSISVG
jgi:WD40 repeat protein